MTTTVALNAVVVLVSVALLWATLRSPRAPQGARVAARGDVRRR